MTPLHLSSYAIFVRCAGGFCWLRLASATFCKHAVTVQTEPIPSLATWLYDCRPWTCSSAFLAIRRSRDLLRNIAVGLGNQPGMSPRIPLFECFERKTTTATPARPSPTPERCWLKVED